MNIPPISCIEIDVAEFNYNMDENNLSVLHLNIATLGGYKDELEHLLPYLNFKFDIIGISETKIKTNTIPIVDILLK